MENIRGEGSGIIRWALDGLARLNERGRFTYPKSVIRVTESYRQENDLPTQFIEECCERAPSEQLFFTDDYRAYARQLTVRFNEWAEGHADWSMRTLAKEWKRLGFKPKRDKRGMAWYGLRLVA